MIDNNDIEAFIAYANASKTLTNQLEHAKTRFEMSCKIGYNGGSFTASRELLLYLQIYMIDAFQDIIIDDYGNPILIKDTKEFTQMVSSKYREACNAYYIEYTNICKNRKPTDLIV